MDTALISIQRVKSIIVVGVAIFRSAPNAKSHLAWVVLMFIHAPAVFRHFVRAAML